MKTKHLFSKIDLKFAPTETAEKTFSGYGSVFNNVDLYGDIVAPGAFAKSLAYHKANGTAPAMLLNHNAAQLPIGVWTDLEEDNHGLKVSGHLIDTSLSNDAYVAAKAGAVTGLSIGYFERQAEDSFIDGRKVRILKEIDVFEISLVTIPANTLARVIDIKSADDGDVTSLADRVAALEAKIADLITETNPDDTEEAKDFGGEDCDCENDDDCECEAEYNDVESVDEAEVKSIIEAITATARQAASLQVKQAK